MRENLWIVSMITRQSASLFRYLLITNPMQVMVSRAWIFHDLYLNLMCTTPIDHAFSFKLWKILIDSSTICKLVQPFIFYRLALSLHLSVTFFFLLSDQTDLTANFDRVFWLGDFNFRVTLERSKVDEILEKYKDQENPECKVGIIL